MSGLKINYDKSVVIGINCGEETIDEACSILECNKAILPIRYLGIPLGANPKCVKTWDPIIKKVKERLKGWEGKFLTKSRFFWSKTDGGKGMPTVKWSVVQKPKKQGGLGVGDISLKNTALLFKLWWRFNKEECLSGGGGSIRRNVRFGRK
ncbi:hypothetical protein AHAS_Ahas18G0177800 [Arachis hypogaea]